MQTDTSESFITIPADYPEDIDFDVANQDRDLIQKQYKNRLIEDVFVVQDVQYGSLQPSAKTRLSDHYKLETIDELQISAKEKRRISRIISLTK